MSKTKLLTVAYPEDPVWRALLAVLRSRLAAYGLRSTTYHELKGLTTSLWSVARQMIHAMACDHKALPNFALLLRADKK